MVEVNSCSAPQHEHIRLFPQHGGCGSLPTPVGCKLTFEISLLRQGEGWRSLSSGDRASVCKYRAPADGGKLALEPYGAYAHGGVCKDPGHGVRAEDRRLLRLAQDTKHWHWHWRGVTVRLNFSWKAPEPESWSLKPDNRILSYIYSCRQNIYVKVIIFHAK